MQNIRPTSAVRSNIWKGIKICLAIGLIILVLSMTDLGQLASLGSRLSFQWLVRSFIFLWILALLKAWQYRVLIGGKLSYPGILRIVIWQNLLSNFVAAGAGLASYFAMFRIDQGVKLRHSGVAFLIAKAGDLLAIGFYLGLSAGLVWNTIPGLHALTVFIVSGLLVAWLIILIGAIWNHQFTRFFLRLLEGSKLERLPVLVRAGEMLQSLESDDHRKVLTTFWAGTCLSLLYMTATMIFAYATMKTFSVFIDIWPVMYVVSILQVISFIPIQVLGGLGITEATSVYFYSLFGFPQSEMSAVLLGLRALYLLLNATTLVYLPIASIIEQKRKKSEIRRDNS